MATRVFRGAGVRATDLAAIVLVGGCCRMPIVGDLLQREFERRWRWARIRSTTWPSACC